MMGSIYIRCDEKELESFAPELFNILSVSSFQIRYSDNYYGGRYFITQSLGLTVQIFLGDDADLPDYNFVLTFTPPGELVGTADRKSLDGFADLLARKLALDGFDVARPLGGSKAGQPSMFYRRKSGTTSGSKDQLEVWTA